MTPATAIRIRKRATGRACSPAWPSRSAHTTALLSRRRPRRPGCSPSRRSSQTSSGGTPRALSACRAASAAPGSMSAVTSAWPAPWPASVRVTCAAPGSAATLSATRSITGAAPNTRKCSIASRRQPLALARISPDPDDCPGRRGAIALRGMTAPDTRPVVLAYDGSAEAQAALREAVALFGHRPLIVASVWEPGLAMVTMMPLAGEPSMGYMPDPDEVAAIDRAQSGHAGDVAEAGARLARELGATAEALPVPDAVNIAGTLIAIAEERDARAIVVGSRGLGGIKARVLGSTSRKLLHDTHRPVLVVRTPE